VLLKILVPGVFTAEVRERGRERGREGGGEREGGRHTYI